MRLNGLRNIIKTWRIGVHSYVLAAFVITASVYLVLDWHWSRREEKNPLSRYLFSTHVASIGRDLAGYNRQRDYYWLRQVEIAATMSRFRGRIAALRKRSAMSLFFCIDDDFFRRGTVYKRCLPYRWLVVAYAFC